MVLLQTQFYYGIAKMNKNLKNILIIQDTKRYTNLLQQQIAEDKFF
jgi:hypothetical protein